MLTRVTLKELLSYDPATGEWRWLVDAKYGQKRAGTLAGCAASGYRIIRIGQRNFLAHRLAVLWMIGEDPPEEVDHINRDRLDNRWSNLRLATPSQNQWNTAERRTNTSGVKGVSWCKRTKLWQAAIKKHNRSYFLGRFRCIDAARRAYLDASRNLHGEFARKQAC